MGHFVVPLWRLMLWFLRNVARNSPTRISNVEITSLEFCAFLDTYEKLGYPNYVRVLVDEAPEANSCVRSSSHDTVHDPRDSSPSRISRTALQDEPALLTTHPHSHQAQLHQPAIRRHIQSRKGTITHVGASQRLKCRNLTHRAGPDPMPTPPPHPTMRRAALPRRQQKGGPRSHERGPQCPRCRDGGAARTSWFARPRRDVWWRLSARLRAP